MVKQLQLLLISGFFIAGCGKENSRPAETPGPDVLSRVQTITHTSRNDLQFRFLKRYTFDYDSVFKMYSVIRQDSFFTVVPDPFYPLQLIEYNVENGNNRLW